jgi:hypothetical protein
VQKATLLLYFFAGYAKVPRRTRARVRSLPNDTGRWRDQEKAPINPPCTRRGWDMRDIRERPQSMNDWGVFCASPGDEKAGREKPAQPVCDRPVRRQALCVAVSGHGTVARSALS